MLNLNGQVSSVIEATELSWLDSARGSGVGSGLLDSGLFFGLVQRAGVSTVALSLLFVGYTQTNLRSVNITHTLKNSL